MNLREFISEAAVYKKCENIIRAWVEETYPGLSIEFDPHLEIVQTDPAKKFTKRRVRQIVEATNIKIGDVLEQHAEEIYIAERLERIYKNHPTFDIENVTSIEDIKRNKKFLRYLDELIIR
jgi:hypothetical protein